MPLVLIEAMFCKRTAIVTDVAGHSELIADAVNGFVVPAAHYKLFAQQLEIVWENKEKLEDYGKAAFETINKAVSELPEKTFSNLIKTTLLE
jgi:glycosyltransferase involved in cell wall biosynthesis